MHNPIIQNMRQPYILKTGDNSTALDSESFRDKWQFYNLEQEKTQKLKVENLIIKEI